MNHIRQLLWVSACVLFLTGTALATPILVGTSDTLLSDLDWKNEQASDQNGNGSNNGNGNSGAVYGSAQQDNEDNVNWLVDHYTGSETLPGGLTLEGKFEAHYEDYFFFDLFDYWTWEGDDSPSFEVSVDNHLRSTQGQWAKIDDTSSDPFYFSVKAGTKFALYYVAHDTQGDWDTYDLFCHGKEISHISFWTTGTTPDDPGDNPNPVPEPSTLVLLGIGILGLARTGRKHMN